MNREDVKQVVKDTVRSSIREFAKKSLKKKQKFQILDLIIPRERKIRSIVGGMETSLGTTLWEPLAKALALKNDFVVIPDKLLCPVNIPSNLSNMLHMVIDDRKKNGGTYNAVKSHDEIKNVCQAFITRPIDSFEKPPKGRGVDIWLRKNGIDYFFDTKTVQPNLSSFTACMEQVLSWYAYYYSRNPAGSAQARIVFPYNPHQGHDFWEKAMGKGRPLEKDSEGWVEGQFWDFCSGVEGTFPLIKDAFTELKESKELEKTLDDMLSS